MAGERRPPEETDAERADRNFTDLLQELSSPALIVGSLMAAVLVLAWALFPLATRAKHPRLEQQP